MKNHVLNGLASAMMSFGMFHAPAQAYGSYVNRSYTRQQQKQTILPEAINVDASVGRHQNQRQKIGRAVFGSHHLMSERSIKHDLVLHHNRESKDSQPPLLANVNRDYDASELAIKKPNRIRELIIVDHAVPNKAQFYRDLKSHVDIVEVNSEENGLAQLEHILANYSELSALHIVSHAEDGVLELGNGYVDAAALNARLSVFTGINKALKTGGDILFYGCELGAGEKGEAFLELIKLNTHVDIAASSDVTGNADKGGDWELEITKGNINSELPFSPFALNDFSAILPINRTITMDGFSLNSYTEPNTYTVPASTYVARLSIDDGDGDSNSLYCVSGGDVNCYVDWSTGSTGDRRLYFDFTGGQQFNIASLQLYSADPQNFTIYSDDGDTTNVNVGASTEVPVTLNWTGITRLAIRKQDNSDIDFIRIDSLVLTNVGAPSNTTPAISIDNSTLAYTEENTSTQVDVAGTVTDADGDADWNGGTLVAQITGNAEAGDELSISDTDGDGTAITVSGTNILSGATDIGDLSVSGGTVTNNTALTITFDSDATNANVQEILQSIRYRSTSDDPGTSNRTITLTATDTNAASANDTRTVSVAALNDEPTLTATGSSPTFTEGGAAAGLFSGASVSTVESGQTLSGFTLTVTNLADGSNEIVNADGTAIALTNANSGTTATNSLSYSVSVSGSTATVTFSGGTISTAATQTLVNALSYQNNSNDPGTSNRVVTLTSLTDSGSNVGANDNVAALAVASTVSVTPVNDEPTLTATGSNPTFTEGGAAASLFSGSSVSTVESGQTLTGFTLTVTNLADGSNEIVNADGTAIALTNANSGTTATNSLSYSVSVAGSTATVTFSGGTISTAATQTLVNALSYQNNSNDPDTTSRVVTLTSVIDSGSNTGANDNVAALAVASTVSVTAINDEPTLTATGSSPTFTEGGAAASLFSGSSVSTVESGQTLTGFTLTVTNLADGSNERLNADGTTVVLTNGTSGTTATNSLSYSVSVTGSTATVTFSGGTISAAATQTLVNALSYQNNSGSPDTTSRVVTLTSVTDSGSNTGANDNVAALAIASTVGVNAIDDDGDLISSITVSEPVALNYSIDTVGEAVNVFDFTLVDTGTSDGLAMTVSQVVINVTGTASDTDRAKVTWRLNGTGVSNETGVYNAGANTLTFSGLSISVTDISTETYTLNAYYNDNTGLTHGQTIILSVDGDTDLTVGSAGTQMGMTSAVNNGTGTAISDDLSPTVTSVSVPANNTYAAAANLDFTVNMNENVTVNTGLGTPRLGLTIGATSRFASYVSGTGTSALLFRYTVQSGDQDLNGIAVSATIDPNNGTLRDGANNNINTTLNSVGSTANVLVDAQAPTLAEVTAVVTPDNDSTPNVTFSTTESGTLAVGGSCGSGDEGAVGSGNQTITLTQTDNSTPLAAGTYSNCTVTVTDAVGNVSNVVTLSSFVIDLIAPTVAEVTAVVTPGNDSTPDVTISTNEAGTLSVGGSCGSASEGAISSGNSTITLTQTDNSTALAAGTYSDCTITVTDASGNGNTPVTLTSFIVDVSAPTVAEVTAVVTPSNDTTPDVTISTNEAGTLAVGGSCGSASEGAIGSGNTTITLTQTDNSTALAAGTYSDCTITVTDASSNANTPVTLTSFTIDLIAPTVAEVTAVVTPGNDSTPDVTISTNEAGTLSVGGSCGSASEGAISAGNSTITLTQTDNSTALAAGTYSDCTVTVTDASGNANTPVTLSSFNIDLTAPTVAEVTAVVTPSNDTTPDVIISTNEAGTLSVGGSCGSANEGAISSGNTTITLTQTDNSTALVTGTYSDCTITVTDASGNGNTPVTLTSFMVDVSAPTVAEVTAVVTPSNDTTPDVIISTNEAGTLAVGGSCGSASEGAIGSGNTTITLTQTDNSTALAAGTYSDCTITVTDASSNANTPVTLTSFTIDLIAPTVAEVTAVVTPGNDSTPDVTISTNEAGTLSVGGSCGSASEGAISAGNSTITLTQTDNSTALAAGTYSDCTVTVTDASGNANTPVTLSSFNLDLTIPTVAEVTAVVTPSNDTTPDVTISTNEAGTLAVGGSCGSGSEGAISAGNSTITLTQTDNSTALAGGTYSDCTVTVTDASGNANTPVTLTSFMIDLSNPTVAELTAVVTPDNDATPNVTITSSEAGTLAVGGSCGSASEGAISAGSNTIALTQSDNSSALADGSYTDCTVTVTDAGSNASNVLTLSAFVVDTTAPAVAANTGISLNEGATDAAVGSAQLSASDNLSNAANITYTVVTAPANGTLRRSGSALAGSSTFTQEDLNNNLLTYDHDGSETTSDSFSFTLSDALANENNNGGGNFSVSITVSAVNDAPVTDVDAASTNEDNAVMVDVLANDNDADNAINAASVLVVSAPSNGATSVNTGTGVITYTPAANFNGADSFSYTVEDVSGAVSNTSLVNITVTPQNDAPVAVADVASTDVNTAASIDVADNDTDVDSGDAPDATTIVIVGAASHGSAVFNAGTNQVDYTPNTDFIGSDSFTYTIDDSTGATSNVATATVTVIDPNTAPTAANDSAITDEDTAVSIDVLGNDSDSDGSLVPASVSVTTGPTNGTTAINTTTGAITYTPAANTNGSDSFTYTVADNNGAPSTAATVTITVNAVNDAPVANGDSVNLLEDASLAINVLGNDSDIDGTLVASTLTIVTEPVSGIAGFDAQSGGILYVPFGNFAGNDSFTYQVSDNLGLVSNVATVTLTVDPINDAPVANSDSADVVLGANVVIDVLANDSDIDGSLDTAAIVVSVAPTQGGLIDNNDGTLTYTPDPGVNVVSGDSFSYTVADDMAASSNVASVSIRFVPGAPPVISGAPTEPARVEAESTYRFVPTTTAGDSNFALVYSVVNLPPWASFNTATGAITGNPDAQDVGTSTGVQISVSDGINTVQLAPFDIEIVARVDTDNDTITDFQEGIDGTDPTNPLDYLDLTPPLLVAPSDIILDANALFTEVNTAQLLGLARDASVTQIDTARAALVSDNVDGIGCCNTEPVGTQTGAFKLQPGTNDIVWRATDRMNNLSEVTQRVLVRPLVSVSKDKIGAEGTTVNIQFILNGGSPTYPLQIPYVIDASSTASAADHNLVDGVVTFNEGDLKATLSVNLVADGNAEADELLVVRLDDRTTNEQDLGDGFNADIYDINSGARTAHQLTIVERNIAPIVALRADQSGSAALLITADSPVSIFANVTDPNAQDSHQYDWSSSDNALVDTDGNATDSGFSFDPSGLALGVYRINVRVTDTQGATDTESLTLVLVAALPNLLSSMDTDGDGIDDVSEGTADTDNDGIPEYLDNIVAENVLPEDTAITDSFLMECDPGVRCRLGQFSLLSESGGARITEDDVEILVALGEDQNFTPESDIFDFEIAELPTPGQSVRIVIPLRAGLPANAVYRKSIDGSWTSFVEDELNELHSSAGTLGFCPPPGDASWELGLIEGALCLQLTIEDGGPNDADGIANAAIVDPGVVSVQNRQSINTSGGGSAAWWMLALFSLLLASRARGSLVKSRIKPIAASILAPLCISIAGVFSTEKSVALDWNNFAQNSFLEGSISALKGSQSQSEFVQNMARAGVTATPNKYDTSRNGYHVVLGYQYSSNIAFTVGYMDLGEIDINFDALSVDDADLERALKRSYPLTGNGLTLGVRVKDAVINEKIHAFADAGIFFWDGDIDADGANINTSLEGGVDPFFAMGLDYALRKSINLGIKYQYSILDGQLIDGLGLLLRYRY